MRFWSRAFRPSERTVAGFLRDWVMGLPWARDLYIFDDPASHEVRVMRGLGPTCQYASYQVGVMLDGFSSADAAALFNNAADWLEHTVWLWDRNGGLVVGAAGKWRLFNRRAALHTREGR